MQENTKTPYDYHRPSTADEIRILTLKPSFEFEAEIQCELETVERKSEPEYTALSYWWGPPDQGTVDIKIGQDTLQIKEELATALRYLRRAEQPRRLWADAICIIQEPHDFEKQDKDAQLRHMDRTYADAKAVVIWLGKSSEEELSWLAMVTIDVLGQQLDNYVPANIPLAPLEIPPILGYKPQEYIVALSKLLRRRWFHRLWVVQEVCLAPSDLTVKCGRHEVPFWKLFYLQLHPNISKLALDNWKVPTNAADRHREFVRGLEPPLGLTRQYFLAERKQKILSGNTSGPNQFTENERAQMRITDMTKLKNEKCTLLSHLWHFRNRECTNDEDRIYALLGMTCDIPEGKIPFDTGIDPDVVFEKATRAIIETTHRLDVLGMCFGPDEKVKKPEEISTPNGKSKRASWVPDFRSEPTQRPLDNLTHYQWSSTPKGFKSEIAFKACGEFEALFEFNEGDPSELIVKGLRIGVIKDSGYEGVQDWREALLKARNLAEELAVEGRNVEEEFWRTLLTNRSTGGRVPTAASEGDQFRTWWSMFLAPTSLASVPNQMKVLTFVAAFNQHYLTRDFFVTDKGHMGLCTLTRKMGDVVCLLAGAQVPFVLRPDGERYRVVGECYVHGVMNGEKWDASSLQTFTLF